MLIKNKKLFSQITILFLFFATIFVLIIKEIYTERNTLLNKDKISISLGKKTIQGEVVYKKLDMLRGLSGRPFLREEEGMLFIFPEKGLHGIWMKDMNFSIDILWLRKEEDNRTILVHFLEDISPNTYPEIFYPTIESDFVLEIPADLLKQTGLKIGDEIFFDF